jgi:hypothetical protein
MESHVIVVGDSSDPDIRALLASMEQAHVDCEICPNVYETAASIAGRASGVLMGRTQTLLRAGGELLHLALHAGWQCGLLVGADARIFPWTLLSRFATQVHMLPAGDQAWQSLMAAHTRSLTSRAAIQPEYLASPEEIASLLKGIEYV